MSVKSLLKIVIGMILLHSSMCTMLGQEQCKPCATNQYKVYGKIDDNHNHKLPKVVVTLTRGSDSTQCRSLDDGSYEICFRKGDVAIKSVTYELSNYAPNTVKNLSGNRGSHNIHIMLYTPGTSFIPSEAIGVVNALEIIFYRSKEQRKTDAVKEQYRSVIQDFKLTEPDEHVDGRVRLVRRLYGIP